MKKILTRSELRCLAVCATGGAIFRVGDHTSHEFNLDFVRLTQLGLIDDTMETWEGNYDYRPTPKGWQVLKEYGECVTLEE